MRPNLVFRFFCLFTVMCNVANVSYAITVSAGNNLTVCKNSPTVIGGNPTATGGTAPYTYSWAPATGLSATNVSNPTCIPQGTQTYTVFVTDAIGSTGSATVTVFIHIESLADAGFDREICLGDTIYLGGPNNVTGGGITYTWTPNIDLSSASAGNPMAWPVMTMTYTLTVNGPNCPANISTVTITVHPLPTVNAGPDVTIFSGQSTPLSGSGATTYYWTPPTSLNYTNIPNPDADPTATITYVLIGENEYGCVNYDDVKVTVIETDSLFFYNTFTPNGDGDNDNWIIGNIYKFPENTLTIFNRNGRQVFHAHPYANNWHGKTGGDELPSATYYYILDKGDGSKPVYGSVTILR